MLVILDPGHNGKVPGKCSPDGKFREYRWAREITAILESKLDKLGISHVRTTVPSEDEGPEIGLTKRCSRANSYAKSHAEKSIFVSVHVNAAGADGKWHSAVGWSVFVSPKGSSNSKKLASYMTSAARTKNIKVRVPDPQHSYWPGNFTVLNKTSMPAVLVENMFQDNKNDVEFLTSTEGKEILADIMIKGICDYFDIEFK